MKTVVETCATLWAIILSSSFHLAHQAEVNDPPARDLEHERTHAKYPLPDYDPGNITVDTIHHRIVGGSEVPSPGVYPFFVSWDGRCGGSLIHSDIVLTAAHCFGITSNKVVINAYKLNMFDRPVENTFGTEVRTIKEKSKHPYYNPNNLANDFLLLKLDRPIQDPNIRPIPINSVRSTPQVGQDVKVVGLGTTSSGGAQSEYLREVTVQTRSDESCNDDYNGDIIGNVMFCAGKYGGGKDSCQGDSGGPAFALDPNTGDYSKLVGVVSWGYGCADPLFPGVYAEVSAVTEWIQREVCRLSSDRPVDCPPAPAPTPTPPPPEEQCDDPGSWCLFNGRSCCNDCFFVCR